MKGVFAQIEALKTSLADAFQAVRDCLEAQGICTTKAGEASDSATAANDSAGDAAQHRDDAKEHADRAASVVEAQAGLEDYMAREGTFIDAGGPMSNNYLNSGHTGVWNDEDFDLTDASMEVAVDIDLVGTPLTNPMVGVSSFSMRAFLSTATNNGFASPYFKVEFLDDSAQNIDGAEFTAYVTPIHKLHLGAGKLNKCGMLGVLIPVPDGAETARIKAGAEVENGVTVDGKIEIASAPYIS